MGTKIQMNPGVKSIVMPENLKVGLMVAEQRKKCSLIGCTDEYYGLAFGQSPFPVPEPLVEALARNSRHGHYADARGIEELREAAAGFNAHHFGLHVSPERIFIGPGTKPLIDIVFHIVAGDLVLPFPSWIGYYPQALLMAKQYHAFPLHRENHYKIDTDELDHFLADRPDKQKVLVLNNPHNPTGAVYTRTELEALAAVCRRRRTLVLADEIYALTTYAPDDFVSMGKVYPEGTFVTNGLSKDRSAGGYRLGHIILPEQCPEALMDAFNKVAATVYTNVTTPVQYAAVTAYARNVEIEAYFVMTRRIHRMMGTWLSREFNKIEGIHASSPHGGFYFFIDLNDLAPRLRAQGVDTSNALGRSLLAHPYHIATVTGDACMLPPDHFGGRVAFVDYDGAAALEKFKANPPENGKEGAFVRAAAPRMARAVDMLRRYADDLRAGKLQHGDLQH